MVNQAGIIGGVDFGLAEGTKIIEIALADCSPKCVIKRGDRSCAAGTGFDGIAAERAIDDVDRANRIYITADIDCPAAAVTAIAAAAVVEIMIGPLSIIALARVSAAAADGLIASKRAVHHGQRPECQAHRPAVTVSAVAAISAVSAIAVAAVVAAGAAVTSLGAIGVLIVGGDGTGGAGGVCDSRVAGGALAAGGEWDGVAGVVTAVAPSAAAIVGPILITIIIALVLQSIACAAPGTRK